MGLKNKRGSLKYYGKICDFVLSCFSLLIQIFWGALVMFFFHLLSLPSTWGLMAFLKDFKFFNKAICTTYVTFSPVTTFYYVSFLDKQTTIQVVLLVMC